MNCIEKSTQVELLNILPQLYNDLLQKKTDTLKDFVVNIRGVTVREPTSLLGKQIIYMMCLEAAKGIQLQCGREYGFAEGGNEQPRATVLTKLSTAELEGLLINNLPAERNLAIFNKRASKVAKSRNYKFTAKSVKNDMQLYKGNQGTVDRLTRNITSLLDTRGKKWDDTQRQKQKERIKLKAMKTAKSKDYIRKLLSDCKTWSGPCTSGEELLAVIKARPCKAEFIVKIEMAYYAHTHKMDKIQRPDLFRLNGITHDEKLENLVVLLSDDNDNSRASVANLPNNDDILKALSFTNSAISNQSLDRDIQINQLCVVIWINAEGKYIWYIGYVKEKNNNSYTIDHLHRRTTDSNKIWQYPAIEDIQTADKDQILDVVIEGDWNLVENRNSKFTLCNEKEISWAFDNCKME